MKKTNKKGFTIVELVIVIAVVAILAAVLIPTFVSVTKKANESNDVQAARNMNTFLAAAKVTDGVDSILDVYDIFEDSGYSVENYKPLYSGRHYYYDKQYNQIVYVNEEDGKIIYPAEHKGETRGDHDWFSLSMSVAKKEMPAVFTDDNNGITATATKAEEYAYVIEEYNKKIEQNKKVELTLTITKDIDLMGATCAIKEAQSKITIKGESAENPVVIKNVTSNVLLDTGIVHNAEGTKADYYSGGLITKIRGGNVTIQNVVFENIHVKTPTAGQVGIVIGVFEGGSVVMDNVTVKNSSVVGHRDVGALVGGMQSAAGTLTLKHNITFDNVKVKTTGGRSGLVVGKVITSNGCSVKFESGADLIINNSDMSIYNDKNLEQKFAAGETVPSEWGFSKKVKIEGQDQFVYSYKGLNKTSGKKEYVAYGYKADALVLVQNGDTWTAITKLTELKKGVNVK